MVEKRSLIEEGKSNDPVAVVKRPFAADFLSSFGASAVGFLLAVVTSILIARTVGPEGNFDPYLLLK